MGDFTAPSFSLGLDVDVDDFHQPTASSAAAAAAPSFSLGLDFDDDNYDFNQLPSPPRHLISSSSIDDDDDDNDNQEFQPQTLVSDSPPPQRSLKRLKRGLPKTPPPPPTTTMREGFNINNNKRDKSVIVDEFEDDDDISSPDHENHGIRIDGLSEIQDRSASSSSKLPLHGFVPLSTQFASKLKARENIQASSASTLTSMEKSSSKTMLPKLTISPLRRFQLLDSDSDDPSSSKDLFEDAKKVDVSASRRQDNTYQNLTVNKLKRDKVTGSKLQTEDLWKDFGPQKSTNIPTPALDEFCDEYFRSVKDKNINHTKEDDICVISSKVCDQKNSISGNAELFKNLHNPLPPAYKYFNNDDPRIQRLVRHRLPNFSPLGMNNTETPQTQAANIDYMCQFSQKEPTSRNQGLEGSSRMGRKNLKQSKSKDLSEIPGSWVSPKGCTSTSRNAGKSQGGVNGRFSGGPKNAGKRRVCVEGQSSGSWFTGEDGRKVYITRKGQELTGQIAYRHYRKESGSGFKKSRKKAASKKKSKR